MKPTVSQLLDLLNKPSLVYWANNLGINGIKLQDYYIKSKKKGISIHEQIYDYVINGKQFENIDNQNNFLNFIKNKQIIDLEKEIENEHFIGRYDIKLQIDNTIYICDFKSNNNIYFENLLQLTAYRMCNKDCKIAIINVPTFEFKEINIDDFSILENILKCLSYIYKNKKEYESRIIGINGK